MLAPLGSALYSGYCLRRHLLHGVEPIEYVEDYSPIFAELPYKFESGTKMLGYGILLLQLNISTK